MKKFGKAVSVLLLSGTLSSLAHAAVTVNINPYSSGVLAFASGSLDLTGLTDDDSFFLNSGVRGNTAFLGLGSEGFSTNARGYNGISGPDQIGPGTTIVAPTSVFGEPFGLNAFFFGDVFVPLTYGSGSALVSGSIFAGETIATLGLTPGTYVFSWDADNVTVNVSNTLVSVPEPASLALLGLGLAGIAAVRRRKTS